MGQQIRRVAIRPSQPKDVRGPVEISSTPNRTTLLHPLIFCVTQPNVVQSKLLEDRPDRKFTKKPLKIEKLHNPPFYFEMHWQATARPQFRARPQRKTLPFGPANGCCGPLRSRVARRRVLFQINPQIRAMILKK